MKRISLPILAKFLIVYNSDYQQWVIRAFCGESQRYIKNCKFDEALFYFLLRKLILHWHEYSIQ